MANLPIPQELQEESGKEEKAAGESSQQSKSADVQAIAKASAPKAKPAASSTKPQPPRMVSSNPVVVPATKTVMTPMVSCPGSEAIVAATPQFPIAFAPVALPVGAGCMGMVPNLDMTAAAGYGQLCVGMANATTAFGHGTCGPAALATDPSSVMQLQQARMAAAMQLQQNTYSVGTSMVSGEAVGTTASAGGAVSSSNPAERSRPRDRERGRPREPHDPKRKFIGTITKWDDDAGFGFLSSWDAYKVYGKDVFVHKAQIGLIGGSSSMYAKRKRSEIRNGDTVSYTVDLSENPGKPRAYNVEKLDNPPDVPISGEAELAKRRKLEAEWKA